MIGIVDYGAGNLTSVTGALDRLSAEYRIVSRGEELTGCKRVIFPGVGHARAAMEQLGSRGFTAVLQKLTVPLLGICLGMQLLFERSEEGDTRGLGLISGTVRHFPTGVTPVPHIGWARLRKRMEDPLLEGVTEGEAVYFVHSYMAPLSDDTIASAEYGLPFSAAVRRGNVWGTQFHPERSGSIGERILRNFLAL